MLPPLHVLVWLADAQVARAEERREVVSELELGDTMLVQITGLVVEGGQKHSSTANSPTRDSESAFGKDRSLHEGGELGLLKARSWWNSSSQIISEIESSRLKCVGDHFVAVLEFLPVETELTGGLSPLIAIRTVGEQPPADIEEVDLDISHRALMSFSKRLGILGS